MGRETGVGLLGVVSKTFLALHPPGEKSCKTKKTLNYKHFNEKIKGRKYFLK